MFYGRNRQLDRFSELWRKPVPSLVVCRGRRRIGKSTLVREFARRSGGVFLKLEGLAPDDYMTNAKQLAGFRDQLAAQTGRTVPKIRDWGEAFRQLDMALETPGRKVVLLDEVSWMGCRDRAFPAKLKVAWDNLFHERKDLIVFLCGSVSTWIRKNILSNRGFVGRISLDTVVDELPLHDCLGFWRNRASRVGARCILDVLSVTGGVPRYLEEVDPGLSSDENIRRLCFLPDGYLFREFNELFNDILSRTAPLKRRILEALAERHLGGVELAERLGIDRNGHLSDVLNELETAGFIAKANGINPETGRRSRVDRYRLRDNYTRFFLRYVAPRLPEIEAGTFSFAGVELLPGWESMMGLQFENLVINNFAALAPLMNLGGKLVVSAAPFRCIRSSGGGGVQIDLLVQTEGTAHIVEIKRSRGELGVEIAEELRRKAERLPVRHGIAVRTVLVYEGRLSPALAASDAIDVFVPAERMLGLP
jgi:AAA+ ATPase superfamily predicted ATPase